jgi:hypothetical protein
VSGPWRCRTDFRVLSARGGLRGPYSTLDIVTAAVGCCPACSGARRLLGYLFLKPVWSRLGFDGFAPYALIR